MPTISVDKAELFKALGKEFTTEEFDELCFEFGIELDEDTSQSNNRPIVNGVQEPPQLKIEIPANRYDMLCFEGIALNLNVFLRNQSLPTYKLSPPPDGKLESLTISAETLKIRPLVSCAILRNVEFTQARYDSFIALQDKLHQNLARQRTLVSIGTHDLDTLKGPFSYEALAPEDIKFTPLNQTKEMNGKELMEFYEKDKHLARYLHIIRDSPVYPVIYDSNRTVCSLPPIINGDHSKISLKTKNIFIEITALDKTKAELVNHIVVAMFSQYCGTPFTIEPVQIISPHNNESRETPDVSPRQTQAEIAYLNDCCGLKLSPEEICHLLERMGYQAKASTTSPALLDISVPITRADVLHQADVMEDVAIAYGFNRLPRHYPNKTASVAAPLAINRLTDLIRHEAAIAGWTEAMSLVLSSHDENFAHLNRTDDGTTAVQLANPKSAEYQVVRTSLAAGLLKTLRENRAHALPLRIFETGDIVLQHPQAERAARNERRFAAAYMAKTSGFQLVHGLLDRLMLMLGLPFLDTAARAAAAPPAEASIASANTDGFWIELDEDPTYLANYAARIYLRQAGQTTQIGQIGVLHPTVLKNFELTYPVSILEFNVEVFL